MVVRLVLDAELEVVGIKVIVEPGPSAVPSVSSVTLPVTEALVTEPVTLLAEYSGTVEYPSSPPVAVAMGWSASGSSPVGGVLLAEITPVPEPVPVSIPDALSLVNVGDWLEALLVGLADELDEVVPPIAV